MQWKLSVKLRYPDIESSPAITGRVAKTVINEVFQKIQGPKREPKWNLRVGDNSASSGNNNHTPWRSGPGSGLKCVRCNAIADKMVNNFLLQST